MIAHETLRLMVEKGLISPTSADELWGTRDWARLPLELRDQEPPVPNPLARYLDRSDRPLTRHCRP